jgi:hypothetical protein
LGCAFFYLLTFHYAVFAIKKSSLSVKSHVATSGSIKTNQVTCYKQDCGFFPRQRLSSHRFEQDETRALLGETEARMDALVLHKRVDRLSVEQAHSWR